MNIKTKLLKLLFVETVKIIHNEPFQVEDSSIAIQIMIALF